MKQTISEIGALINSGAAWIIGVSIGLIGKISYELYMKRSLSILQWIAVIGMSIISGYLMSTYCQSNHLTTESQFLVPIATLLGEKVFIYLMENYQRIVRGIVKVFMKK